MLAPYIYGPYSVLDTWLEGGAEAMSARHDEPSTDSLRTLESALDAAATFEPIDAYPMNPLFAAAGSPPPREGEEAYPLTLDLTLMARGRNARVAVWAADGALTPAGAGAIMAR